VNAATRLPIIIGSAGPELKDKDWLGAHNVRVALQGHQPFSAAVQAVYETLKALREGTPPSKLERIASDELLKRVTRDAEFARMGKDLLGG
jgi:carboxyvinyl-carboxyphosphonate phosphorylmutase